MRLLKSTWVERTASVDYLIDVVTKNRRDYTRNLSELLQTTMLQYQSCSTTAKPTQARFAMRNALLPSTS
jgi:hypothetical protein